MLIIDFVRFIFVVVILSSVSLLLMLLSHLVWISFSVWCLCWMTCSHRNTHIRWADSVSRICRSLTALPSVCLPCCSSFGCWGWLMLVMPPHPRMIPSVILGHWGFSWGQCSFASFQITRTGVSRHVVNMCSIVSVVWHVGQSCLSSYPWMCVQKCPIFWVLCMALYRNCRIFIRMVGLCSPSHRVLSVSICCVYSVTAVRVLCRFSDVDGLAYGCLRSSIPLYAVACVSDASFAPCRLNSFGMVRSSVSGIILFAPSLTSRSLSSFP